ncbi:MAG: hypothetical protein M1831_001038 [Alyxoria varia]|nr:MAG: hypothetical protein M1831_001038 [Alyxoria varia]
MPEHYHSIAKRKQAERDSRIPAEWKLETPPPASVLDVRDVPRKSGILSQAELEITEKYDATPLAEAVRSGHLKCVDVTLAFCKRAAIAQQVTNCITEPLFDSALQRAAALDHHLHRHGIPVGPLHGIPISVKDTFKIAGTDASIGLAALCFQPSTSTSPLISLLLSAGAVIHCKTNVPQTLGALDSVNNVFGRTLNPQNRKLTAGGSSGGEGALLQMRGSALGVGTDIAGSIRIPAMCNGVYGLKPSGGRVPFGGQEMGTLPASEEVGIGAVAGPLGHSLRDCELFLRTVSAAKPWERDPAIVPGFYESSDMSLSGAQGKKSLTIGVLSTDGLTTPLPPISALLTELSTTLKHAGHTIIPLPTPPSLPKIHSLMNALMSIDGRSHMQHLLTTTSEPLIPWLDGRLKFKTPKTLEQVRDLHAQRLQIAHDMLSQLWSVPGAAGGKEIDVLVCPVAPHPVPPVDTWGSVNYTSAFVLLDYPAGVVPVRTFNEDDARLGLEADGRGVGGRDAKVKEQSLGEWDDKNRRLWSDEELRREFVGSCLSVQVVAPRLQERRLVRGMEAVERAVRGERWGEGKEKLDEKVAREMGGMGGAKL